MSFTWYYSVVPVCSTRTAGLSPRLHTDESPPFYCAVCGMRSGVWWFDRGKKGIGTFSVPLGWPENALSLVSSCTDSFHCRDLLHDPLPGHPALPRRCQMPPPSWYAFASLASAPNCFSFIGRTETPRHEAKYTALTMNTPMGCTTAAAIKQHMAHIITRTRYQTLLTR